MVEGGGSDSERNHSVTSLYCCCSAMEDDLCHRSKCIEYYTNALDKQNTGSLMLSFITQWLQFNLQTDILYGFCYALHLINCLKTL